MAAEVPSLEASFPLLQDTGSGRPPELAEAFAPQPVVIDEDITPEETYVSVDDLFGSGDEDADLDED
jgi:hypothetical protein